MDYDTMPYAPDAAVIDDVEEIREILPGSAYSKLEKKVSQHKRTQRDRLMKAQKGRYQIF